MSRLSRLARWPFEESPHTERLQYRLGAALADDGWRRPTRIRVLWTDLLRRLPSPDKGLYRLSLRSSASLSLPDALCIGAQKAGTTWLHENLEHHPEAFVPPRVKEVHYFDFLYQKPLAEYAAVFAAGRDRVKCDVTPNYGRLRPGRIRFIRRVMPRVRLVFLMRNPIERAWSQALMDLVSRTGRAYEEVPESEFLAHLRSPSTRRNGLYTQILERWLAVFPPEQLFVGFFEDVQARPRELLAEIFRHIGVTDRPDWDSLPYAQRFHGGVGIEMPDAFRAELAGIFAEEIGRLAARYGGPAEAWRPR